MGVMGAMTVSEAVTELSAILHALDSFDHIFGCRLFPVGRNMPVNVITPSATATQMFAASMLGSNSNSSRMFCRNVVSIMDLSPIR
jgi:hypothetical protein